MNLDELRQRLDRLADNLTPRDRKLLTARLAGLGSGFPFNEYEYMLMFLLDKQAITFAEYEKLRSSYLSANPYLDLFALSPRVFGEIWGQQHVLDLDASFQRASQPLDPAYDGEYDLWLDGIRVEVKAARAIHTRKRANLTSKALRFGESAPFWMNYQQLKPDMADVFILIGVWADRIIYWLLSQDEVKTHRYLSRQHRGGIEYQIGITHKNLSEFDAYRVEAPQLAAMVRKKGSRLTPP